MMFCVVFSAGSVLLNDEAKNAGDIAINMDHPMDKDRYQQQLQLIDEQVKYTFSDAVYGCPINEAVITQSSRLKPKRFQLYNS
jgi:hypothetical protein